MTTLRRSFVVVLIVLAANFAVWAALNRGASERAWGGPIASLSYSGYHGLENRLTDEQIDGDMAFLSHYTRAIRTYSTAEDLDRIPAIAGRHGLEVIAGAWIGRDAKANEAEIGRIIALAKANPNITRIMVGNEALLRTDVEPEAMIGFIEQVKRQVSVPVSTAEPWHIWLKYPDLVQAVDFITVHTLPYWEGVPVDGANEYVLYRWKQLASAFPGKHIMIGEVGWPSDGQWVKGSEPSLINQAKFIRSFLNMASGERLDYSIIEAFDDPWKRGIEGSVGAHWGLWDVDHNAKFPMSGIVVESAHWLWGYAIASLLALFPILFFIRRRSELRFGGHLFYAGLIQITFSLFIWGVIAAVADNIISANMVAWCVLLGAQIVLLILFLVDGYELTEVMWADRLRAFKPQDKKPGANAPKVSIHVPCYNEPPQMVIETMNALAKMDYPNFEVLIIDNNTKDEAVWKPLEEHCAKMGPRFRFFHLPNWPGYKAGALNFALTKTAQDAKVIGVIDSDYIVSPNWLRATIPYFDKPEVAFVQAPQDYRDGHESLFKRMCYWEYAGFFHIGMVQRNERNAIIQHGTMTLIRKVRMEEKKWAEWCICEDAELGLRLFESGYESVYLEDSFGKGLIPDSFGGYKTQRFRWAYGAVQILKKHWRNLCDDGQLTRGQRYHFISGWLPWFADAAHLMFAIAAILWSALLLLKWVEFPPAVLLVPTLSVFVFKVAAGLCLYHARVNCGWKDRIGAAIAGMGLTHAVGRAVWQGMFTSGKPFFRTPKCADAPAALQAFLMAREEICLLVGLLTGAFSVLWVFEPSNKNAVLWCWMLCIQTLPYWAAFAMSAVNTVKPSQD